MSTKPSVSSTTMSLTVISGLADVLPSLSPIVASACPCTMLPPLALLRFR